MRWVDVIYQWLLCGLNIFDLPCTSSTFLLCTVSCKDLLAKKLRIVFIFLLCILVPPSSVQNKLQACDVTSLFTGCCLLKKPRHTSDLHLLKINKLLVRQCNLFVLMINKKVNSLNNERVWIKWAEVDRKKKSPPAAHPCCPASAGFAPCSPGTAQERAVTPGVVYRNDPSINIQIYNKANIWCCASFPLWMRTFWESHLHFWSHTC